MAWEWLLLRRRALPSRSPSAMRFGGLASRLWIRVNRCSVMPDKGPLRVSVVVDKADRRRREFWTDVLTDLKRQQGIDTTVKLCPLADMMRAPLRDADPVFLEQLQDGTDVLVVNWDAINGDPDFGADAALSWFNHRHMAVRDWLNGGGVLILEGQAVLGVPSQDAYDALLGDGELAVCGAEDPSDPGAQERRMQGACRTTRTARRAKGFTAIEDIRSRETLTHDDMFPPETSGRLVAAYIRRGDYRAMVYRGWFRRRAWRSQTTLRWLPYIRRAKLWPLNYSTMLVAKVDKGAIFATTMLLSGTGQTRLIQAILSTHGRVSELPEPERLWSVISRHGVPALAGLITSALTLSFISTDWYWTVLGTVLITGTVTLLLEHVAVARQAVKRLVSMFTGA